MCEECGNVLFHDSQDDLKDRLCLSCPQSVCCVDGWFVHLEQNSNIKDVLDNNIEFFKLTDNAFKENHEDSCYEDIIAFVEFLTKNQKFILNQDKQKMVDMFSIFQMVKDNSVDKLKILNYNTNNEVLMMEIKDAMGDNIY